MSSLQLLRRASRSIRHALSSFCVSEVSPLGCICSPPGSGGSKLSIELPGGTLSTAMPLHTSSILFLVGGGRSPLYPPNKVVLWDDVLGKDVAELEFREKVRGLACRRGWFAVALRRRIVVFKLDESVSRFGEWDTCDNPRGLQTIHYFTSSSVD